MFKSAHIIYLQADLEAVESWSLGEWRMVKPCQTDVVSQCLTQDWLA